MGARVAILKVLAVGLAFLMIGCSSAPDVDPYRQAIKDRLRDPASAEFKDESIRTLWTVEGSRKKIYCAMVNSNNAFGGKAGFGPAQVVISANDATPHEFMTVEALYPPGKTFIDNAISPNHYLNCQRADTQRTEENIFSTYPSLGRQWDESFRVEIDKQYPVLSMDVAPEER